VHASTGLIIDQEEGTNQDGETLGGPSTSNLNAPFKSQRLIQQALLTLIQHNICWHVCISPGGIVEEAGGSRGVEYFQINVDDVLPRVRFGTYLAIAEEEYGNEVSRRRLQQLALISAEALTHTLYRQWRLFVKFSRMAK
jgi:hypothetical protein